MDVLINNIFLLNRKVKISIQVIFDVTMIFIALFLSMLLRLGNYNFLFSKEFWYTFALLTPIMILTYFKLGLYQIIIRYISGITVKNVLYAVIISSVSIYVLSYLFSLNIPRSIPIIFSFFILISTLGIRFVVKQFFIIYQNQNHEPIAIYGAGKTGRSLVNIFRENREFSPKFFLDDDLSLHKKEINGLIVRNFQKDKSIFEKFNVRKVLLAIPNINLKNRKKIFGNLADLGIQIKIIPNLSEFLIHNSNDFKMRSITIEEILNREPVKPNYDLLTKNILNKSILITGGGGSIGSELCKQVLKIKPKSIVILENSEISLFQIHKELLLKIKIQKLHTKVIPLLKNINDKEQLKQTIDRFKIDTVYHAAAYKHVPLTELNIVDCLKNNVYGTENLIKLCISCEVENFIMISTDKAVRPTNFMGASKRLAELICQSYAKSQKKTKICMVRFGNVMGSSGSVIPEFRSQIEKGGPVEVTHKDITRYFMTITEAVELVIQAGAMSKGGDLFVLDMGKPIKILDLAFKMIKLQGLNPKIMHSKKQDNKSNDIYVKLVGLRPGEKLYEELLIDNNSKNTEHKRIFKVKETPLTLKRLNYLLKKIFQNIETLNYNQLYKTLSEKPINLSHDQVEDPIFKKD